MLRLGFRTGLCPRAYYRHILELGQPFGSALSFAAVWDGYDLVHEFTGIMTVTC